MTSRDSLLQLLVNTALACVLHVLAQGLMYMKGAWPHTSALCPLLTYLAVTSVDVIAYS